MKKTKLTRSLLAACSIVALSAVMYGCAHTDSGPSQDEYDAAVSGKDAAEAAAKINADAAAEAVAAKATADTAAAAAAEAKATADAAAEKARMAQEAAEAQSALDAQAKIDADAAAAEAAEDARIAQEAADAAQMEAEAARTAQMEAEAERDAAQLALEENQQQMQDDATAADIAKRKRLHAGLSNDAGDVAEDVDFDDAPGISATHGMPAESEAPGDDIDVMTGGTDEIAGFTGTQLDWSDGSYMHTITAYTDIDETTGIPFGQVYDATDGSLLFTAGDADADLANNKRIVSDDFVKVNTRTHNFNADGPDPDSDPDHVAFEGTYHGAEGVFRCSTGAEADPPASMCASTRNSDGSLTLSAMWTFTPNPDAMVQITDGIYMYFGWWLRENLNAPANTGGLSVQTFAGVKDGASEDGDRTASAAITGLIGKATFEGAAVGKFALYDPAIPGGNAVAGGHFTADATLTADFEADEVGTISGMIDNFLLVGNANGPSDPWSVALMSTALTETAEGIPAGLHFATANDEFDPDGDGGAEPIMGGRGTQWSIGDRKEARAGDWGGTFYDSADGDADATTADRNDLTPGYAVGEFSAEYGTIGRMLGAFGTDNVTPDRDAQ